MVLEATEETTQTPCAPEDFVLLDNSLWVQDGSMVFASFMIENPSMDLLYEDVEFTILLLDENGNLVDEDYQSILWFFPGQTIGLVTNYWLANQVRAMIVSPRYSQFTRSPVITGRSLLHMRRLLKH